MSKQKIGIGFKLTLLVSSLLLIAFISKGGYDSFYRYSDEMEKQTKTLETENLALAKELEGIFSKTFQTTLDLLGAVEYELSLKEEERSRERLEFSTKKLLEYNEFLSGLGVFFERNVFDGRDEEFKNSASKTHIDGRFIPYADKSTGAISFRCVVAINDDSKNEWYRRAFSEKKTILLSPYLSSAENKKTLHTTIAMPIVRSGECIGVLNADIDAGFIQEILEKVPSTSSDNFKVVYADNGVVVANGLDESTILKNVLEYIPSIKPHFELAAKGEGSSQVITAQTTGQSSKFIFEPIILEELGVNWLLVSISSVSFFVKEPRRELISTAIQYFLIVLSLIVILYFSVRKMVSIPLQKTADALKDIAMGAGDLTVRLAVNGNDEITDVARYFNRTIEKIENSVKSIDNNATLMKDIGAELASNMSESAASLAQISSNVQNVKEQSLTQAQSVSETASTMEEIIRTISQLNTSIEG